MIPDGKTNTPPNPPWPFLAADFLQVKTEHQLKDNAEAGSTFLGSLTGRSPPR